MDGKYHNNNEVIESIQNWMNTVIPPDGKWEQNNLHIDEVEGLEKIDRSEWINTSLVMLNIILKRLKLIDSLIVFLHIDLKDSLKKMSEENLSLTWLNKNVSEYTPPSLNVTSLEHYTEFYHKELVSCEVDSSILSLIHFPGKVDFFYRTYWDEAEGMYSREVYIFMNGNNTQEEG